MEKIVKKYVEINFLSIRNMDGKAAILRICSKKDWEQNRTKNNNLTINYIDIINQNKIRINFNSNFKNSLTKYIIVITPVEKNNTFENLKDFCFLTELINQRYGNFIAEEIYDIGENDFIEIDIVIDKFKYENKEFIVNIICQELRYEKELRFYEPKMFKIERNINVNKRKNVVIMIVFVSFLIVVWIYIKKSNRKINNKNPKMLKIKMNYEDLGTELNDSNEFTNNKNK